MTEPTTDLSMRAFKAEQMLAAFGDGVVTADQLAAEVGICVRTVYRYIRFLRAAGHPILSEAGIGYMMRRKAIRAEAPKL